MTELEDRIRAAVRAAAETVADDSAPPVRLTKQPSRSGVLRRPSRLGRRRFSILAPAGAAAAVIAVTVAAVAVTDHPGSPGPARGTAPHDVRVPPYYLTLVNKTIRVGPKKELEYGAEQAIIKKTSTGATVASASAPRGDMFITATGAANDRTFVLAALPLELHAVTTKIYEARFNAARGTLRLRPLPISALRWHYACPDLALSPSGTELAVGVGSRQLQIHLYSLAGQLLKTWHAPGSLIGTCLDNDAISWSETRTLAITGTVHGSEGVWLLNTRRSGGSLASDSRLVIPWDNRSPYKFHLLDAGVLSGNGRTIATEMIRLARLVGKHEVWPAIGAEFQEISAATGHEIRALWPVHVEYEWVVWSNWSGSVLVVHANLTSGPKSSMRSAYGVLAGHRFAVLPRGSAPVF